MASSKSGWLIGLAALAFSSLAGGLAYAWEHHQLQRARKALWEKLADPADEDARHTLVPLGAEQVTDWYLAAEDPIQQGWVYPGRLRLTRRPDLHALARTLHAACLAIEPADAFEIQVAGQRWQGHVIETIAGDVFALRRVVSRP